MGESKRKITISNNVTSINVTSLISGIYVLKINIDGVIESHQIAVQ
jgi:hypothetical protein